MGTDSAQLDTVVEVFDRLGIAVRWEHLGGTGGGLCRVRGEQVLFIDSDADPATRLERTIVALAAIPDSDSMYLIPAVRERVDRLRESVPNGRPNEHSWSRRRP